METLLVAVDGSPSSRAALGWAIEMARGRDAEVLALHVSPDVFATAHKGYISRSTAEEWAARDREEGLELLRSALDGAGGAPEDVTVHLEVQPGYPPQVLIDRSHDVSMLVVGARGLGPLRSLLGSVSRRCVEQAGCPVTVVRDQPQQR